MHKLWSLPFSLCDSFLLFFFIKTDLTHHLLLSLNLTVEAGAILLLQALLSLSSPSVQENLMIAVLNQSLHDKNNTKIIEEEGIGECTKKSHISIWQKKARPRTDSNE